VLSAVFTTWNKLPIFSLSVYRIARTLPHRSPVIYKAELRQCSRETLLVRTGISLKKAVRSKQAVRSVTLLNESFMIDKKYKSSDLGLFQYVR